MRKCRLRRSSKPRSRIGCESISYTYTEPTIYFELAYDTARLAVEAGLKNVFVSNGYITPEALTVIKPYLHAANIDLKGYSDVFYKKVCGARLQPVLDSIRLYREFGIWIEITTLVIPGHNDSDDELKGIAQFIKSVGEDIPWHVSRFHPTYKLTDQPVTPLETLKRARRIGFDAGLRYVYEGNIPGEGEDTRLLELQEDAHKADRLQRAGESDQGWYVQVLRSSHSRGVVVMP